MTDYSVLSALFLSGAAALHTSALACFEASEGFTIGSRYLSGWNEVIISLNGNKKEKQ